MAAELRRRLNQDLSESESEPEAASDQVELVAEEPSSVSRRSFFCVPVREFRVSRSIVSARIPCSPHFEINLRNLNATAGCAVLHSQATTYALLTIVVHHPLRCSHAGSPPQSEEEDPALKDLPIVNWKALRTDLVRSGCNGRATGI